MASGLHSGLPRVLKQIEKGKGKFKNFPKKQVPKLGFVHSRGCRVEIRRVLHIVRAHLACISLQTDDLRGRVKRHRGAKSPGRALDFYALHLPEGKSRSRELEANLIRRLADAGVPLANKGDQNHTRFGVDSPAGSARRGNGAAYEPLIPTPIAIEPPF
jgi:hypothetical protein